MPSKWDDEELFEEAAPPGKKRAGRPAGSKNKPRESLLTTEKLEALYNRVKPYLPDDQRKYVEGVISGDNRVDPLLEMELLVRQMSIIFSEAGVWHFDNKRVSQDFGQFANSLRMSIKDLFDMRRHIDSQTQEANDDNDMVPITKRGSTLERLDALLLEHSTE